jgi:hypothetical protein
VLNAHGELQLRVNGRVPASAKSAAGSSIGDNTESDVSKTVVAVLEFNAAIS